MKYVAIIHVNANNKYAKLCQEKIERITFISPLYPVLFLGTILCGKKPLEALLLLLPTFQKHIEEVKSCLRQNTPPFYETVFVFLLCHTHTYIPLAKQGVRHIENVPSTLQGTFEVACNMYTA